MVLRFLIWCADGMLPLQRALREKGGEEEERRLFYVALTRAKDQIYLCCPVLDYNHNTGNIVLASSRFIKEIESLSAGEKNVRLSNGLFMLIINNCRIWPFLSVLRIEHAERYYPFLPFLPLFLPSLQIEYQHQRFLSFHPCH